GEMTIRAMSDAVAEAYAAWTNDASVKHFAHLPLDEYTPQIVRDMIRGVIADGLRDGTLAVLTICYATSDSFLVSLVVFDVKPDDSEIGYWVAPEHRGRKISVRALSLTMKMARKLGLKRLRARTVQDNPASEIVLLKAGFEQVGMARPEIVPSGTTEMSGNDLAKLGGIEGEAGLVPMFPASAVKWRPLTPDGFHSAVGTLAIACHKLFFNLTSSGDAMITSK